MIHRNQLIPTSSWIQRGLTTQYIDLPFALASVHPLCSTEGVSYRPWRQGIYASRHMQCIHSADGKLYDFSMIVTDRQLICW